LNQLLGFKNRLEVLVEWTTAYFGRRSTSRLDVVPERVAAVTTPPGAVAAPAGQTTSESPTGTGRPPTDTAGGPASLTATGARDGG
jgi:hypothetical protein